MFQFELDLTKITSETESTVSITGLSINDPCINDGNQLEQCHGQGQCQGHYENFSFSCKCNPGWGGLLCQQKNYCTMINQRGVANQEICQKQKLECENKLELETFGCKCKETNEKWNDITLR